MTLLGPVRGFAANSPKNVDFTARVIDGWTTVERQRAVWGVRRSESDFWVYNPHCTHLGCAYHWDEASARFRCPCHGGVFTIDGPVVAGPPPRPLDTMEWKVENGSLYVIGYHNTGTGAIFIAPLGLQSTPVRTSLSLPTVRRDACR